jgi:hypothetical protein
MPPSCHAARATATLTEGELPAFGFAFIGPQQGRHHLLPAGVEGQRRRVRCISRWNTSSEMPASRADVPPAAWHVTQVGVVAMQDFVQPAAVVALLGHVRELVHHGHAQHARAKN